MKKPLCYLLAVVIALLLCACMTRSSYTVEKDGVEYLVDTKACTISDDTGTYPYSISGDASGYRIQITFPDDFEVVWQGSKDAQGTTSGFGSWSGTYNADYYAKAEQMSSVLSIQIHAPSSGEQGQTYWLAALLLLAVGIFYIAAPRAAWQLWYGWRYKDAEPTEIALRVNVGLGMAAALAGLVLVVLSF